MLDTEQHLCESSDRYGPRIGGLERLILDYRDIFPDVDLRPCAPADIVEEHARWPWRLSSTVRIRILGKDYGHVMDGLDIIEFDDDGKIKKVVSFFGPIAGSDTAGPFRINAANTVVACTLRDSCSPFRQSLCWDEGQVAGSDWTDRLTLDGQS